MTDENAQETYDLICKQLFAKGGVTTGKMLKAEALKTNGKSFAYLSPQGLVLKLPVAQIDALEAAHKGERLVVGKRVMREWVVASNDYSAEWQELADMSYRFVAGVKNNGS